MRLELVADWSCRLGSLSRAIKNELYSNSIKAVVVLCSPYVDFRSWKLRTCWPCWFTVLFLADFLRSCGLWPVGSRLPVSRLALIKMAPAPSLPDNPEAAASLIRILDIGQIQNVAPIEAKRQWGQSQRCHDAGDSMGAGFRCLWKYNAVQSAAACGRCAKFKEFLRSDRSYPSSIHLPRKCTRQCPWQSTKPLSTRIFLVTRPGRTLLQFWSQMIGRI